MGSCRASAGPPLDRIARLQSLRGPAASGGPEADPGSLASDPPPAQSLAPNSWEPRSTERGSLTTIPRCGSESTAPGDSGPSRVATSSVSGACVPPGRLLPRQYPGVASLRPPSASGPEPSSGFLTEMSRFGYICNYWCLIVLFRLFERRLSVATRCFGSWTLAVALALAGGTSSAHAGLIIGNLPLANDGANTLISQSSGTTVKAAGFTMNSGADISLDAVTLRLKVDASSNPLVQILNNASGVPGTVLTTLVNPVFNAGIIQDYDFTSASPFVLQGGSSYWVQVKNLGSVGMNWMAATPNQTPTGPGAVNLGYKFGNTGNPATNNSSTFNGYRVRGLEPVPEPATWLQLGAGLVGLICLRVRLAA